MDVSVHEHLMAQFVEMVDRPDLLSTFPEQFVKHWENQGKSGTVQMFSVRLEELPCEITFSMFFTQDGEEIIQTGIHVKFKNETIINEVRKGDVLEFRQTRRIDPVAFLKENYGSARNQPLDLPATYSSFTLAVDDDAEEQVFQAVEQLTGKSEEELRAIWESLVVANAMKPSKEKVSPIIVNWLKKQRDRLDLRYLRDVNLLEPREENVVHFAAPDRFYTVVTKGVSGDIIRDKIDHVEPELWGGRFYGLQVGTLVQMPHDPNDRLLALRSFTGATEFPVEEIFIDSQHIYTVLFSGREAIVWRTRNHVSPIKSGGARAGMAGAGGGKIGKFVGRLKGKSLVPAGAAGSGAAEDVPAEAAPQAPEVHPFVLARAEKAYAEALRTRSPALNEQRKAFMELLYKSDRRRFAGRMGEFVSEFGEVIARALGKELGALRKEAALVEAHVTIFYSEVEGG